MNSLLYGFPDNDLKKFQRIQNSAARLLSGARKYDHITPILEELHWLPVRFRTQYKITLIVFKAIHGLAPKYIEELFKVRQVPRSLRSSSKPLLEIPRSRMVRAGDRAFQHAAPVLWNNLPASLMYCDTLDTFKLLLKTYLFRCAYQSS